MLVSCVTLNSQNLCEVSNSLALSGSPGPSRRVPGVPPVPGEAAGLRRLQREDPGPLHAAGAGPLLARGLPQVRLLRLPTGPAGLHPLHPGQPHPLPQGLPQVSRQPERPEGEKLELPTNHSLLFLKFSDRRSVPFKICLLIVCCASKKIQLEEFWQLVQFRKISPVSDLGGDPQTTTKLPRYRKQSRLCSWI